MIENLLTTAVATLLVWKVLLLIPMVPGKLIDTRDFSSLPRWQYNWFNVFLTSLGLASLVVAGFAVTGNSWVFLPALVLALLYIIVFFLDLFEIFPVVKDKLPVQLLILEAIVLASAGILVIVSIAGLRILNYV
jgi:hypothetical protein